MAAGNTDWPSLPEAKAHSKQHFPGWRPVMLTSRELEQRTFTGHLPTLDNWECPQQRVVLVLNKMVLVLVLACIFRVRLPLR